MWIYFDSQHKHILAHLRKIYDDANNTIQSQQTDFRWCQELNVEPIYPEAREELNSTPAQLNGDLRFSILALDSTTPDNIHSGFNHSFQRLIDDCMQVRPLARKSGQALRPWLGAFPELSSPLFRRSGRLPRTTWMDASKR